MKDIFCFIPSWYTDGEQCGAYPQRWVDRNRRMEFDDTVNQIRLFRNAGERVRLILPCYMPELRRFLHREGILDIEIWSPFDEIQGIEDQFPGVYSYHDIGWPSDLEWVYTPFLASAFREDELFGRVEFGNGGHMIYADFFSKGQLSMRSWMDDRGFVSSSEIFREGRKTKRIYYNTEHEWVLKENLESGRVTINPQVESNFTALEYPDMHALIWEKTAAYISGIDDSAVIIAACDNRHNQDILDAVKGRKKTVFSIFTPRNKRKECEELTSLNADILVADSEYLAGFLRECYPDRCIIDLPPYDARVAMGQSQRLQELKIFCFLKQKDFMLQEEWFIELLRYTNMHPEVRLVFGYGADMKEQDSSRLKLLLERFAVQNHYENLHLDEYSIGHAENDTEEYPEQNVFFEECVSEEEILHQLKDARLIVDPGEEPDLYIQIAGISAGIPMLLRKQSQYVEHKKNGWVLENSGQLEEALDYYLIGLKHWNQSLVHCVSRISGYTNGAIVDKWKRLLEL